MQFGESQKKEHWFSKMKNPQITTTVYAGKVTRGKSFANSSLRIPVEKFRDSNNVLFIPVEFKMYSVAEKFGDDDWIRGIRKAFPTRNFPGLRYLASYLHVILSDYS